jgi:3D (Asp-Asp-Asp) domain-containing protein
LQYPPGVSQNTQPNPKEVVVPSAAGTTPGGLSQFSVWYQDSYGRSTPPNSFKLASFGVTCYIVAVEADWYNSQTQSCGSQTYYGRLYEGWWENPPGLPGRTLCSAFLGETRVNGSGLTRDGTKIKWVSGDTYAVVSQWTTAQGDIVDETKANQIVARDTSIIPLGQPRVYLDLASIGSNILAGDIGGAIGSYRLDLFKGIGHASGCPSGWTSRIAVGTCSPETAGCPKQEVQ